ncbi:MAG: M48 family metallopeptidase [Rhodobacteraceae bacterium]|nr:M48 family metallopeptidase [Paracoccaceae bacterium]
MDKTIALGSPPIEILLCRSARARRYSLRVSNSDGRVRLTLPKGATETAALDFAVRQEGWIRKALARQPLRSTPGLATPVLFQGENVTIVAGKGRSVALKAGAIEIPGPPEAIPAKLRAFLKVEARTQLAAAADRYAGLLGRRIARISLRDTKSRWGSCTPEGNLMFSWRLIMAPPEVLQYVAAHEVAHLVEMNHSAAFWAVVARLKPGFEADRRWLKKHGAELHRLQF